MVFYQPAPARIVLKLIDELNMSPEDVFYDIGSGLGRVPILVALLTGARARGIEFEPAYYEYARRCAGRLSLSGVEFINVDAREADYSEGTIFFMYTPFHGKMLQTVLERLRSEARTRTIAVCTYGRCTIDVARQYWLRAANEQANGDHRAAIFQSI